MLTSNISQQKYLYGNITLKQPILTSPGSPPRQGWGHRLAYRPYKALKQGRMSEGSHYIENASNRSIEGLSKLLMSVKRFDMGQNWGVITPGLAVLGCHMLCIWC